MPLSTLRTKLPRSHCTPVTVGCDNPPYGQFEAPRLVLNDLELTLRADLGGLGIIAAPFSLAAPHVQKKHLVQVLRPWTLPPIDLHAVYPAGGALVPKTGAFLDMLQEGLAGGR